MMLADIQLPPSITSQKSTARASRHDWRAQLASCGKFAKVRSSDYEIAKRCGVGSYSNVVKAKAKSGAKQVAIKVFQPWRAVASFATDCVGDIGLDPNTATPPDYPGLVYNLAMELDFIERIGSHPYIIKVLGVCVDCPAFVMEAACTDLYQMVKRQPECITMDAMWSWSAQLASALTCIHQAGVVHLDMKTSNVLITSDNIAKICDFGNSSYTRESGRIYVEKEMVTMWYRAPELLMGARAIDNKVDVWGLGAILLEMLMASPAFPGNDEPIRPDLFNWNRDQMDKIFRIVGTPDDMNLFRHMPGFELFRYSPRHRSVIATIVQAAFRTHGTKGTGPNKISQAYDASAWIHLVTHLLELRPERRYSATEALYALTGGSNVVPRMSNSKCNDSSISKSKFFWKMIPFASCGAG